MWERSGVVKVDRVVIGAELVSVHPQVDERRLGLVEGISAIGVSGEFGGVAYRNFLEFPIALCPSWTLQVRSWAVNSIVLISDVSSGFPTRCRCS